MDFFFKHGIFYSYAPDVLPQSVGNTGPGAATGRRVSFSRALKRLKPGNNSRAFDTSPPVVDVSIGPLKDIVPQIGGRVNEITCDFTAVIAWEKFSKRARRGVLYAAATV